MKQLRITTLGGEYLTFLDSDAEKADRDIKMSLRYSCRDIDFKHGENNIKIFTKYIISIRKSGDWGRE